MKRVLVDLNVVLDVLLDRAPHAAHAAALWAAIEERRLRGAVAAHGFTTLSYLIAKQHGRRAAARAVTDLLDIFEVAPVDESVLRRAAALDLPAFEDAVAVAAGEAAGCDLIVTRDVKDFRGSPLEALDPPLALAAIACEIHERGGDYEARSPKRRRRAGGTRGGAKG